MAAVGVLRTFLALLLAYVYGVLGVGFGVAFAPFLQRGLPFDGAVTVTGLALLLLATASFALEVALFLVVLLAPAAIVTLPLTYAAARWLTLPRWAATLLGIAFAMGLAWPLGSVTMGGEVAFPGRDNALAAVLGGTLFSQSIWHRCMRPRIEAASAKRS
jgi:hypothetical protein